MNTLNHEKQAFQIEKSMMRFLFPIILAGPFQQRCEQRVLFYGQLFLPFQASG
ncbi:hypothetical protein HPT25_04050 [Bacillus sp. BRMEA1]|uniref:hypothetical protein n=1 Tax=Neobacillus endophyticus TaxID=2738405 RepID=UPI001565A4F2|nr:hypothetical protein [Neobacillus endophyticus]NRD76662.1 hypothetical protein [Neobacillus endophyticus]